MEKRYLTEWSACSVEFLVTLAVELTKHDSKQELFRALGDELHDVLRGPIPVWRHAVARFLTILQPILRLRPGPDCCAAATEIAASGLEGWGPAG
jgi:hypothetical protein